MKVYVVMDHVCEADILVAAFSTRSLAEKWIKAHENDPYGSGCKSLRYESLAIEECKLNP